MAIIQVGESWQFGSEFELEEVVWQNLPKLLGLKPFKRQYCVRGQYCDILALDEQQRLVVIELKNAEDRYVVQQLTRYYDALKEETPFGPEVDVEHIRLIAIAPSFHQDTLVDCKYNLLNIELISFLLQEKPSSFFLTLIDNEEHVLTKLSIKKQEKAILPSAIEVSTPSRKLLNWLSYSPEKEFKAFITIRNQILSFDERVKELIEPQRILYGRGKSKPCAEIRLLKAHVGDEKYPALFLWLPHPENKPQVLRMMIWANKDWTGVQSILHSPSSNETRVVWNLPNCIKQMETFKYSKSLQAYKPLLDEDMNCSPCNLVGLALRTWQGRL